MATTDYNSQQAPHCHPSPEFYLVLHLVHVSLSPLNIFKALIFCLLIARYHSVFPYQAFDILLCFSQLTTSLLPFLTLIFILSLTFWLYLAWPLFALTTHWIMIWICLSVCCGLFSAIASVSHLLLWLNTSSSWIQQRRHSKLLFWCRDILDEHQQMLSELDIHISQVTAVVSQALLT